MSNRTDRIEMYRPILGMKMPKSNTAEPMRRYAVVLLKTPLRNIAAPTRNPVREPRM